MRNHTPSFVGHAFARRRCARASLCATGDTVSLCGDGDGSHGGLHQSGWARLTQPRMDGSGPRAGFASIVFQQATEFGAAWKKTARETEREYLSVKLDDPSFPAPIYASLVKVEGDEGFTLIWSRRNGD